MILSGEPDLHERALGVPFLQKPVTPERLLEHLQRAMPPARQDGGAPAMPAAES